MDEYAHLLKYVPNVNTAIFFITIQKVLYYD